MCELGVFPIFLENDLLKVDRILGLTFFKAKKKIGSIQYGVFHFTVAEFCTRWIVNNSRAGADLGLILTDFLNEGPREQASRGAPGNFF